MSRASPRILSATATREISATASLSCSARTAGTPTSTALGLLHGHWFVDLDVFHKGLARARDEAGWTHVDREGRAVHPRRFAAVEPFYKGQARVERFDGGREVIDEYGETKVVLR